MHEETLINEIKIALNVALFKEKEMHQVAGDKSKTKYGYYILIAFALLSFIGQQFFLPGFMGNMVFHPSLGMGLLMAALQVAAMIIGIYVMSFIAQKVFKGHATHGAFFRVMSYALIVGWLSLFPALGIIAGLWGIALMYVILKAIHKLTTGGAVGTIIIGIIIACIINGLIMGPIYGKGMFNVTTSGSYNFDTPYGEAVMDIEDEDSFEMNIPGEDGMGNVKMDDGTMTITGPDGEVMEITIPQ